jgi:hypothetical protein
MRGWLWPCCRPADAGFVAIVLNAWDITGLAVIAGTLLLFAACVIRIRRIELANDDTDYNYVR